MQVLKSIFFAVATLALITIALAQLISPRTLGQAAQAQAGPTVTINSAQLPLPVTADVTASGTIKTQEVDNPARHAFQFSFSRDTQSSFVVPADQRLTIETASATCIGLPAVTIPFFPTSITTKVGVRIVKHQLLTYFQ